MNIEIANRLINLRKQSGLSQEELAAKLGLSRQAVSKWERAEASPDTDNLICLAKIYGVSLDDLLNTEQPVEEIAREVKEKEEEKPNANTERIDSLIGEKGLSFS
ncbi:MAG: helix-turn-helix transcriptional regulator, partial [Bacilli bacterium]|nr:helix-turn-helix transcriptional regulator [Bacilli bacterium]